MKAWISAVIRYRKWVLFGTLMLTFTLMAQLKSLQVIIDPDSTLPQNHPYIVTGTLIEKLFGNKYTVVIGVSPKQGDIFQKAVLEKVQHITSKLQLSPAVVKSNLISLSARKAKDIVGTKDGMVVNPLMESIPQTEIEMQALRERVGRNPVYENLLISKDHQTTQIVAEFEKIPGGFQAIQKVVDQAVDPERDDSVNIYTSGVTLFLALLEKYSERMSFLFPLALLIIGLIHYEAFRTVQALILPLVTALLAVIWAMGVLGLMHEPFDVFNSSTPILILAIAAGHAVQILKRYYEEYSAQKKLFPDLSPTELNQKAVLESLTKVGPVMLIACIVAALGFFSLMIFEIKSIRTFGIFTGSGVLSALVLELTFIPALRSLLPAPKAREISRESEESFWDRLTHRFYQLAMFERKKVYICVMVLVGVLSLGGYWLKIDNSQKGYFYGKIQQRIDDDALNARMGGTNPVYVLIDGLEQDSIKKPETLNAMEGLQREIEKNPNVGKTVSIVDFIKKMNLSMNADEAHQFKIPDNQNLVAQYLLLYSTSGEPGDFDSYVDNDYQRGVITAFVKSDSSVISNELTATINRYAAEHFPKGVKVQVGGGNLGGVALNEIMIHEKVLNILQIMAAVFLISSLVFRSFFAGLLILVPLAAAVFVNFGVMGLLGIPLQIATALVSAMAVGIGADYGIYMSYRLREELKHNQDEQEAVKKAFKSAGKAAIFVSTAVAGGFGVLMLSVGFMIHMWMGFLIAIAMLVSSVTSLTLFPALIFTFRPKFIFGIKKGDSTMNLKEPLMNGLALLVITSSVAISSHPVFAQTLSAMEIAKRSFSASKIKDSTSDSVFRLINASGQERVRETQGQTKLIPGTDDNRRIVTFLSPADVKGTKTLLVEHTGKEDDIWVYLPALKKVRRLVSSNKKDSFVGTDFSYGDVIGQRPEEWNHKIIREEKVDGKDCYLMESTPINPTIASNTGYSKQVGWIDKESFIAVKGESYDLNGQLLKTIASRDIKKVDEKNNKWQAMVLEANNVQTNHKTILEFKNYKANVGVGDEQFTARYLEK